MDKTLTGQCVVLRPFGPDDITDNYVSWLNDPEVVRYSNQRFTQHSKVSCRAYLDSFAGTPNRFFLVCLKETGASVGTMTAYIDPNHNTADVGIMIGNRAVWGLGVGQDAWNTLVRHLLEGEMIRKVCAGTMTCNRRMVKIMEHTGMTMEAIRREQELLDGEPIDIVYFAAFSNRNDGEAEVRMKATTVWLI